MLRSLDVWFGAGLASSGWSPKPARARKGGELGGEATAEFIDIPRNGKSIDELELQVVSRFSATLLDVAGSSLS